MIFQIPKLIETISSIMKLEEGDIILTGTPEGIGSINIGDRIEAGLDDTKKGNLVKMTFDVISRKS
jgi:acylpyruvate hydrolase